MSVNRQTIDDYREMIRSDMKIPEGTVKRITLNNDLCAAFDIPELIAVWHEETGIPKNRELIEQSGTLRVLITGSRERQTVQDKQQIMGALIEVIQKYGWEGKVTVVYGACPRGIDFLAHTIAVVHNFSLEAHPADWAKYGRAAGPIRNQEMVDSGINVCLAFPGIGPSTGTMGTVEKARRKGIPTYVYRPEGKEER